MYFSEDSFSLAFQNSALRDVAFLMSEWIKVVIFVM